MDAVPSRVLDLIAVAAIVACVVVVAGPTVPEPAPCDPGQAEIERTRQLERLDRISKRLDELGPIIDRAFDHFDRDELLTRTTAETRLRELIRLRAEIERRVAEAKRAAAHRHSWQPPSTASCTRVPCADPR